MLVLSRRATTEERDRKTPNPEKNGNITGFIVSRMEKDHCYIDNIDINKKDQQKGIGRALVTHVENIALANGRSLMKTDTTENAKGIPWKSYGFWIKNRIQRHRRTTAHKMELQNNSIRQRPHENLTASPSRLLLLKFLPHRTRLNISETSRSTTLKVPFNSIESHHKTPANRAKNTNQNSKQRLNSKLKSRTFTLKKNFATHTNPTPP